MLSKEGATEQDQLREMQSKGFKPRKVQSRRLAEGGAFQGDYSAQKCVAQ